MLTDPSCRMTQVMKPLCRIISPHRSTSHLLMTHLEHCQARVHGDWAYMQVHRLLWGTWLLRDVHANPGIASSPQVIQTLCLSPRGVLEKLFTHVLGRVLRAKSMQARTSGARMGPTGRPSARRCTSSTWTR